MVSKIAVIALVAIVASPILLGYAMNLTETTETDYRASGEAVNVTQLLQNDVGYSYAHGEIYQMNTNFGSIMPVYESVTSASSSLPMTKLVVDQWPGTGTQSFANLYYYYIEPHYDHTLQDIYVDVIKNGSVFTTIHNFNTLYYDAKTGDMYIKYYQSGNITGTVIQGGGFDGVTFYNTSGSRRPYTIVEYATTSTTTYANFAGGFHFNEPWNNIWHIYLPNDSKSVLMTVNLDSINDDYPNYSIKIADDIFTLKLIKTTVGSDVKWELRQGDYLVLTELYYDPSRSDNTYQISLEIEMLATVSATRATYNHHMEVDYVGGWPTLIGKANSYWHYENDQQIEDNLNKNVSDIRVRNPSNAGILARSPTMRIDDSYYRAFEYPVIADQTYSPANFKTDPITTITNPVQYGTSLSFGGNTYTVSNDGKITISGHDVPVKGLVLSSVPNGDGTYDNKIGNTVISTTATPSSIGFNGKWSASISTQSLESYTYTKTEWHAGSFGWDGVDQNFLIVGLITCLAVFIGLGIYARKSRSGGIIPLMIVTGCAAAVFFIML